VRHDLRELDPTALEAAFRAPSQGRWAIHDEGAGRGIAIDSTARQPFDHFAAPRLGALAQTEQLILAPAPRVDQSHEIPPAPLLLAKLGPSGYLLTLEAEHCQKTFEAAAVHGPDPRVQVKGHQPTLRRAMAPVVPTATVYDA
jgi:hypothetical protein